MGDGEDALGVGQVTPGDLDKLCVAIMLGMAEHRLGALSVPAYRLHLKDRGLPFDVDEEIKLEAAFLGEVEEPSVSFAKRLGDDALVEHALSHAEVVSYDRFACPVLKQSHEHPDIRREDLELVGDCIHRQWGGGHIEVMGLQDDTRVNWGGSNQAEVQSSLVVDVFVPFADGVNTAED